MYKSRKGREGRYQIVLQNIRPKRLDLHLDAALLPVIFVPSSVGVLHASVYGVI
jgi:hypothetical protein